MLQEEERAGTQKELPGCRPLRCRRQFEWPPKSQNSSIHRGFCGFAITPGLKRVTWPPPPEEQELIFNEQPVYSKGPEGISPSANPGQPQSAWSPPAAAAPQNYRPSPQKQSPVQAHVYQPVQFEPPPATVVLRPEAPISQPPPPVFSSQPAATKGVSGRMRGDEKWPPESYKVQAQAENEARLALARGPAFRPRRVKKDYTAFFAQNALNPTYPGYRAPPGTQHYIEEGTSNL